MVASLDLKMVGRTALPRAAWKVVMKVESTVVLKAEKSVVTTAAKKA